jgi:Cu(I)/Ag(I) efflux system membrane protein CusA/SilA
MLIGLVPLLWATTSGADVMKRIAAPMVGGLLTSAFLTLEIIPVVVTYWRLEQLLWERLAAAAPQLLRPLKTDATLIAIGACGVAIVGLANLLMSAPPVSLRAAYLAAGGVYLLGTAGYLFHRPAARRAIWPRPSAQAA